MEPEIDKNRVTFLDLESKYNKLQENFVSLQHHYDELLQKYTAEINSMQHIIDGDFDKWNSNTNKRFATKKWSSLKQIKLINGNLVVSVEDEKKIMNLEKDLRILVVLEKLDNFLDFDYIDDVVEDSVKV